LHGAGPGRAGAAVGRAQRAPRREAAVEVAGVVHVAGEDDRHARVLGLQGGERPGLDVDRPVAQGLRVAERVGRVVRVRDEELLTGDGVLEEHDRLRDVRALEVRSVVERLLKRRPAVLAPGDAVAVDVHVVAGPRVGPAGEDVVAAAHLRLELRDLRRLHLLEADDLEAVGPDQLVGHPLPGGPVEPALAVASGHRVAVAQEVEGAHPEAGRPRGLRRERHPGTEGDPVPVRRRGRVRGDQRGGRDGADGAPRGRDPQRAAGSGADRAGSCRHRGASETTCEQGRR